MSERRRCSCSLVIDAKIWVLDTGATNHMSGCRSAFRELDTRVLGSVRFGDDSMARIEGRGTVVLECKNGEPKSLEGVYYILQLTTNIVCIGQFNEARYKIDIDGGIMRIREPDGRLLAKVLHGSDRLYVLHIKLARPGCNSMRENSKSWRWHARFGHVHMVALWKLARE